jgi:hypothetical protein
MAMAKKKLRETKSKAEVTEEARECSTLIFVTLESNRVVVISTLPADGNDGQDVDKALAILLKIDDLDLYLGILLDSSTHPSDGVSIDIGSGRLGADLATRGL